MVNALRMSGKPRSGSEGPFRAGALDVDINRAKGK
jgi:hypothetical protein